MTELFTQSAMRFYRVATLFCDKKLTKRMVPGSGSCVLAPVEYPLACILLQDARSIYNGLYGNTNRKDFFFSCDKCKIIPLHSCFLQRIVKPFGEFCLNNLDKECLTDPTPKDFLASVVEYVDTLASFETSIDMLNSFHLDCLQYVPEENNSEIAQLSAFCTNIITHLPCKPELEYACLPDSQRYMAEYASSLIYDNGQSELIVREDADPFSEQKTDKAFQDIFESEQYKNALADFNLTKDNIINR